VLKDAKMQDTTKVIDIAMLGAHDAFSHKINLLSAPDPAEDGIVTNKLVNGAFKGGLVRVLRAQQSNAKTLLNRGVRYFDVRISRVDESWYTKHGLLDSKLDTYVKDIYEFLIAHPDEFIIFDIQHIYTGTKSISDFLTYFTTLEVPSVSKTLSDFIHYTRATSLATLTYGDVRSSTTGGIILLLNDDGTSTPAQQQLFYERGNGEDTVSIRSKWHNVTKVKAIIPLINAETSFLETEVSTPYFRVNQAQLTPDYLSNPLGTLTGWSLINIAAHSNKALLTNSAFLDWLDVMPIFMVDFANSQKGNFNKTINEKIIAYNEQFS
jgi:hypothetical protein